MADRTEHRDIEHSMSKELLDVAAIPVGIEVLLGVAVMAGTAGFAC